MTMTPSQDQTSDVASNGFPPDLAPGMDGRDEMNLSEYPIALLADRAPKDVKTLVYKDRDETLTITGSDLLGLPTALDIDVIIGLLYLTKQKNDFTAQTISFSRYELLQVLRWSNRGRHYERITESLNRWVGVTLIYKKSWWDNDNKTKGNASFHIIDAANVVERDGPSLGQQQLPLSTIRWGTEFFRSCQANNLKRLNLEVYFSLESSISKQLYRFLDKRFYRKPVWTFDLRTLACEHVGLSRNYPCWKIKQKLKPALDELTSSGFLRSMGDDERYSRVARGEWKITLAKNGLRLPRKADSEDIEPAPLERELLGQGVTATTAREFLAEFPEERIRRQLEHADFLVETGKKEISNRGAYLAKAIREDFAAPPGFEPKADREKRQEAERARELKKREEARSQKAQEQREQELMRQTKQLWETLTEEERRQLEAQALAYADEEQRIRYNEARPGPHRRLLMVPIREAYLRTLIG